MDLAIVKDKSPSNFAKESQFIKNNFKIRTCIKYKEDKNDICSCNRSRSDHKFEENGKEKWSYNNNTDLEDCNYHGRIRFAGCDDLCTDHKFLRFNIIGCDSNDDSSLSSIVQHVHTLTDVYWKIPTPKLIISVIGGFKRMDISNQQKKNFKQGLIDIMKKDQTVIIAGGFNVGVHKLVSETVREFRIHYEKDDNHVHLIGICTWGVVWNNEVLGPRGDGLDANRPFFYPNSTSKGKGKVLLDPNCDSFLFCDDGTERQYDKEVDFRLQFEKYSANEANAFAVQILCEGGYRAVFRAHKTLETKISIVVLKGSGRAADLISDVMELKKIHLEKNILAIIDDYKVSLGVKEGDILELKESLIDMYRNYSKQIVIYNMFDTTIKFGQRIVEAIISGQTGRSLEDTLTLTIRFNCADIAQKEVFLHPDYSKIGMEFLKKTFIQVLKENKYEFVILFIENDIDIANMMNEEKLIELYEESRNIKKCPYADLLNDLITNKHMHKHPLDFIEELFSILSGNILQNFYSEKQRPKETFDAQDLFLWSLLSGRIELSEIFWRFGKDHVSTALIGSTILKNMAYYILMRGDSELEKKLTEASTKFEGLVFNILTTAYGENKRKTYTILIRELKSWNNMTCLRIALSGNLLEFLSHSACRSYTTQVWMGGLSPFLSLWKILLTIPFSLCCMHHLIMPSFYQKIYIEKPKKKSKTKAIKNPIYEISAPEECNFREEEPLDDKHFITFGKAMKIFYSAPIVKFYINFASYLVFLLVFAYLNLVELNPRNYINGFNDVKAEIFICAYILTFIMEEVRQIFDQDRIGINQKVKAYFCGSCNQLDTFIIFIFIASIIVRFILPEDLFMICRSLYSICYCMFCLRTMQFYFAYEFVGPKVIMINNMIRDIIFFLSIFALFIISFGTLSHSMRSPNSVLDIFLIKDILQMPYFQTYGELMLDKLFGENACNTTSCYIQQTTVGLGFAIYLLLTNILLVNLLIAMFGYTFNQIQDQSGKYWLFIRLQLVEEFYTKPILSPPLNIFYYCYRLIKFIKPCFCRKVSVKRSTDKDNLLLKILPGNENLKIAGFEQICMESTMDEMQTHLSDFVTKNYEQTNKKSDFSEKTPFQFDQSNQQEIQDIMSTKSFMVRYDKRLEKIENNIDRLISKENV